jgi:hypothetical protein
MKRKVEVIVCQSREEATGAVQADNVSCYICRVIRTVHSIDSSPFVVTVRTLGPITVISFNRSSVKNTGDHDWYARGGNSLTPRFSWPECIVSRYTGMAGTWFWILREPGAIGPSLNAFHQLPDLG